MSDSRLGGKARRPINQVMDITKLHIHTMPTMSEALRLSRRQFWAGKSDRDDQVLRALGTRPVDGNKERLKTASDASDRLIEDAIIVDPRLAKRAQWLRRDEGEHCDAGLLAQGDDQPFYKHSKAVINDSASAGEPLRVVISTDDKNVPPQTNAAFIATARIVQQFMPLEVWWQGAWLSPDRDKGFVFLVPLVQGDMDFSRLDFCISDEWRDLFSYNVMASHAVLDVREAWNGCGHRAERSYLKQQAKFVSHGGIAATGDSIASTAAYWLGLESVGTERWELAANASSAAQELPPLPTPPRPSTASDERQAARSRKESQEYYKQQRAKAAQEAAGRLQP
jgi:hypothetical protein